MTASTGDVLTAHGEAGATNGHELRPKYPHFAAAMNLMSSIRGCAALAVAAVHAVQVFILPYFGIFGALHLLSSFVATYAVMAFFVVSGFMIFLSQNNHRDAAGRFDIGAFFAARMLRIYPPLLTAVAVSLAVYVLVVTLELHGAHSFRLGGELFVSREKVAFEWERLVPTILLLYNVFPGTTPPLSIDGPLWTLSYEWWFYIFVMFAAAAISGRSLFLGYLPLAALLVVFARQPSGVLFWVLFCIWMSGFVLGWLYARNLLASPRFPMLALVSATVPAIGIYVVGGERWLDYFVEPLQRLGDKAHLVMLFVSLLLTILLAVVVRRGSNIAVAAQAARYSYTLYLLHYPLLLLAFALLHPRLHPFGWVPSAVAAAASLGAIVWLCAHLAATIENRELFRKLWTTRLVRGFAR